jgi:hypothetical protein
MYKTLFALLLLILAVTAEKDYTQVVNTLK